MLTASKLGNFKRDK